MGNTARALPEGEQKAYEAALALEHRSDFEAAKPLYADLSQNTEDPQIQAKAQSRLEDMDDLIAEKALYARIDENAKRLLSEVGMNVGESQPIMDILMGADAIDFENETAPFIPLRRTHIDECLDRVPRSMARDPGPNTFGTGATPPFLKRTDSTELRSATRQEFEAICATVKENSDAIGIFSLPVATDRSISAYEVAQVMAQSYEGLKMTVTKGMSDQETTFLKGKDDWVDGTSLITSLSPMGTMVDAFLRSARTGNNLLLLDLSIAGLSGAGTPEALLTQIHAQVLFMMVLAQTVNPGVFCMHGGIPGVAEFSGDLSYSSPHQPLINAAMARVNQWITKYPSAQSGGSTSLLEVTPDAIVESTLSRNTLRKYGVHVLRHAMGALGSLNFFSLEKFVADCEQERQALKTFQGVPKDKGVIPLYFPADEETMSALRDLADKGCNPKQVDHTLKNVSAFTDWEETINAAARRKLYYPQLSDTVIERIQRGETIP